MSVSGKVAPETVNPVPVMFAELTVTDDEPVDESVSDCVAGAPTVTLPKARLVAFAVRTGLDGATPVPLSCTVTDGLTSELLAMTNCPDALPAAVGLKWMLRLRVLLAAIVAGSVPAPSTVNAPPLTVRLLITMAFEVEFERVILFVVGEPTVTLPNDNVTGETLKLPALALRALFATMPPHPVTARDAAIAASAQRENESR